MTKKETNLQNIKSILDPIRSFGIHGYYNKIKSKLFLLEAPGSTGFLHKSLDFILVWISSEARIHQEYGLNTN